MAEQTSLPFRDFDVVEELIRKLPLARREQELLLTIFELSATEQQGEQGAFRGSRKRIAAVMAVSVKTVQRLCWICEFYKALLIERGDGDVSLYRLNFRTIVDRPPCPDLAAFRKQTRSGSRARVEPVPGQKTLEPVLGNRARVPLFRRIGMVIKRGYEAWRGRTGDTRHPDRGHQAPRPGSLSVEPGTPNHPTGVTFGRTGDTEPPDRGHQAPRPGSLSVEPGSLSVEPGSLSVEPGTQPGTQSLKDKRQEARDTDLEIINANKSPPPIDTGQKTDRRTFGFQIRAAHFNTAPGRWDLYTRAMAVGFITNSESDRSAFFALLAVARQLPPIPGKGIPNPAGWLIQRLRGGRSIWDSYILPEAESAGEELLAESLREAGHPSR